MPLSESSVRPVRKEFSNGVKGRSSLSGLTHKIMVMMNKRAQSIAELAIFGSLILLVLGVLLNYSRNIREQQILDQQVFRQTLRDAYNYSEQVDNGRDGTEPAYGATISHSRTMDRQAGLLFEPNRRTYAASYNVFWSGAENPPALNRMEINQDIISLDGISQGRISIPRRKITEPRSDDAWETPDAELEASIWDAVIVLSPALTELGVDWVSSRVGNWFVPYAAGVTYAAKFAVFGLFLNEYHATLNDIAEVEARRESLKDQDEQYQNWGWRVSTESEDEADGIEPGKYYVKEVDAQISDTWFDNETRYDYTEIKNEDTSRIRNMRSISLTDTVNRSFTMRYDTTKPDSSLPPPSHTYEPVAVPELLPLSQGLGQDGRYSSAALETGVSRGQIWETAH